MLATKIYYSYSTKYDKSKRIILHKGAKSWQDQY